MATMLFSLAGGVSDTSSKIVGRISGVVGPLQIEYADNAGFTSSTLTATLSVDADLLAKTTLTGLTSNTQYYYRYVDNAVVVTDVFKFKTTIVNAQHSFTMGFGGCARATGDSPTYGRIRDREVDFFQSLGDTTYIDDETVSGIPQKTAWFAWLARSDVREMNDNIAYSYIWDDHDFGNNDSNGSNPAKTAQQDNFRNIFPSHDLENVSGAVYYAYTVGRVRIIVPDLRSERVGSEIVSTTQMAWIKQEFLDYSNSANLKAVVFVSSSMWLGLLGGTAPDSWEQAAAQRTELTDYIVSLGVEDEMVLLGSDLHVLCGDSGANNHHGTGGTGGWPVYHSAPMAGTVHNNPTTNSDLGYASNSSGGSYEQYAVLDIVDLGNVLTITFNGYDAVADNQVITHTKTIEEVAPVDYRYGFLVTIPTITGTATNFPLLLTEGSFPSEALDGATKLLDGGGNIRAYTDDTKTTRLPLEVVSLVTGVSPTAHVYVKIPSVSSGTTIYLEGDDTETEQPGVAEPYGRDAVWSEYEVVTHDFYTDSTGNHTLTNVNVSAGANPPPSKAATGSFGGIANNYYVESPITSLNEYTISVWSRPTAMNVAGLDVILLQDATDAPNNQSALLLDDSPNEHGMFNTPNSWIRSGATPTLNTWQLISASNDGSSRSISVNGVIEVTGASSAEGSRPLMRIGARKTTNSSWFYSGEMAEARVRKEKLTANYLAIEYANQNNPDSWVTVGLWENQEPISSTIAITNTDTPDGIHSTEVYNTVTKTGYTENVTFSGGSANITATNVPVGTKFWYMIEGINPPTTGVANVEITA